LRHQRCDPQRHRLGDARRAGQPRLPQGGHDVVDRDAANAMGPQGCRDAPARESRPGRRIRRLAQQRPEPRVIGGRAQREPRRVDAKELIPQPIGQTLFLFLQFFHDATQLPQLNDRGIVGVDAPKRARVGAQAVGECVSIPPVVFGTTRRKAIAKPIELSGIDREDPKPVINQRIDEHAARRLNRHGDGVGRDASARPNPRDRLVDGGRRMGHAPLAADLPARVEQTDGVFLTPPINAHIPGRRIGHVTLP
jgi:hypothetical protein